MSHYRSIAAVIIAITWVAVLTPAQAEDDKDPSAKPGVLAFEALSLPTPTPVQESEQGRRRALLERLIDLDGWRSGMNPHYSGGPGFEPLGTGLSRVPEKHAAHAAFTELVALGPAVLPMLLEHLDDKRPTKLVQEHSGGFGGMWLATELDANPVLSAEITALRSAFEKKKEEEGEKKKDDAAAEEADRSIKKHAFTIGDCCYVLIGQITNRSYEALRYQPTGCYVVNSPTADARLAKAVRAAWQVEDLRTAFAERLMQDLHTTMASGWRAARGTLQVGAAIRLAYYFPAASAPTLVSRVRGLRLDGAERLDKANGLITDWFLQAMSEAKHPTVRAAVAARTRRSTRPDFLLIALTADGQLKDDATFEHVRTVIRAEGEMERRDRAFQGLLAIVGSRWPDKLRGLLEEYVESRGIEAVRDVVDLFHQNELSLPTGFWRPLLNRKEPAVTWESRPRDPLQDLRVCDFAALQIAKLRKDFSFDPELSTEKRDDAIDALRKSLQEEEK